MVKRMFLKNRRKVFLPFGFHLVEDLVPLFEAKDSLKKSLSREAKTRLRWMDYYQETKNVSLTCRHFGISRQLFYYWKKRYNPHNLISLENRERTPKKRRQREITPEQEMRIVALRKKYIRYGKEKLSRMYYRFYRETIRT